MKKIVTLLAFACVLCSLSAQRVSETVTLYGKEQLSGFTINLDNAPQNIVEDAIVYKFMNQFQMKDSKKKGYHVYENQPCNAFGDARYDIYFCTNEIGKKNDKRTQVTLVVSTGNMNCITFSNDPRTSRNIVQFMEGLTNDVEAYKIKLRIEELKTDLANLEKERQNLIKEQTKVKDKQATTYNEMKATTEMLEKKNAEINTLQEKYNASHDAALNDQITALAKEKQTLQKTQSNLQKTLLNLNEDMHKIETKLATNAKVTEEKKAELEQLQK